MNGGQLLVKGKMQGGPDVLTAIPGLILQEEAPLIIAGLVVHNVQHILPHAECLHAPASPCDMLQMPPGKLTEIRPFQQSRQE